MRFDLCLFSIKYVLNIKFRMFYYNIPKFFLILRNKNVLAFYHKCAEEGNGSPSYGGDQAKKKPAGRVDLPRQTPSVDV